jgi:hypothetical protein
VRGIDLGGAGRDALARDCPDEVSDLELIA